jgi:CNT family concentrative nucleoside transporter
VLFLLFLAWLISEGRRRVHWRSVALGLGLQLVIAAILLRVPFISESLFLFNGVVEAVERATRVGSEFMFGYVAGGDAPFSIVADNALYIFAFRVLPQIIVFSVLVALFWYWGVLRWIVRIFGKLLQRAMGLSGALGTAAASSVFLGMVETPLVVRAYLAGLSRSELFTLMTCGMSTVAGSIMVLYASVLREALPGTLGHILAASVINVIGAVVYSRIMVPPTADEHGVDQVSEGLEYSSNMDAITRGTADGLRLAVNVGAMVVVLVSLVALVNQIISVVDIAGAPLTLERFMGWVFSPVAWLIGVPWHEAQTAGGLLGSKLVLNELIAYLQLAALPAGTLSPGTTLVMIYALCGFANFGSLGIMLAGLNTLVPQRRDELLSVAPRTLISGTVVGCNTGAIVALVTLF